MNTEEKEVRETEYGNWRKFEIDEYAGQRMLVRHSYRLQVT